MTVEENNALHDGRKECSFDESILLLSEEERVYTVYTMPRQEFRFREFCSQNGIICYLPLKKGWWMLNRSVGGKQYQYPKQVMKPMFPSYAFVKTQGAFRSELFRSNAIAKILDVEPPKVPHFLDELRAVRAIELIGLEEELDYNAELKEGQAFIIESGPWEGVRGILRKKRKRFNWQVELECVGTVVAATIDPSKYKMSAVE